MACVVRATKSETPHGSAEYFVCPFASGFVIQLSCLLQSQEVILFMFVVFEKGRRTEK